LPRGAVFGRLARAMNDLHDPHPITPAQQAAFREQGFIKLKNVFPPATPARYGQAITDEVARRNTMPNQWRSGRRMRRRFCRS
jgi:hypothetical protein